MNEAKFPRLFHGKPDWPRKDDEHLFWVGLRSDFRFAHHPAHLPPVDGEASERDEPPTCPEFFCAPKDLVEKLLGVLLHSNRGSVLITGYRGTGKTSLVNRCRERIEPLLMGGSKEKTQRAWNEEHAIAAALGARRAKAGKVVKRILDLEAARQRARDVSLFCGPSDGRTKGEALCWIKVNLSTVSTAHEVLLLTFEALKDELEHWGTREESGAAHSGSGGLAGGAEAGVAAVRAELARNIRDLRAKSISVQQSQPKGFRSIVQEARNDARIDGDQQHLFERGALSYYQSKLVERLHEFRRLLVMREKRSATRKCGARARGDKPPPLQPKVIFVFDELDKLQPAPPAHAETTDGAPKPSESKLQKLQSIVAELKYFLTESPSHQIFIAGKDVDDSWSEDQNKGEGLFESIFTSNIYVPSIFSPHLVACEGGAGRLIPAAEREEFYITLAAQLGLPLNSWAYKTALLVLPHLAEHEIYHMLLRAWRRHCEGQIDNPGAGKRLHGWLQRCYLDLKLKQAHLCAPSRWRQRLRSVVTFFAGSLGRRSLPPDRESLFSQWRRRFVSMIERCIDPINRVVLPLKILPRCWFLPLWRRWMYSFLERTVALLRRIVLPKPPASLDPLWPMMPPLHPLWPFQSALRAERKNCDGMTAQSYTREPKMEAATVRDAAVARLQKSTAAKTAARKELSESGTWLSAAWCRTSLRWAGAWIAEGWNWFRAHLAWSRHALTQRELENVMSERTCRRLRILIEYLTYKGRGIPRKILREFHDMVQPVKVVPRNDPGYRKVFPDYSDDARPSLPYVLAFPQHHLQKMNFYAGIVEHLDQDVIFAELRGLNDKGRVSIYHIIDYILKFYATGFSQRDVEHANFMTTREEFYPTRQLVSLMVRMLEGRLWKRKDSRSPEFRLLHPVVHDLSVMFLRYAPEQMELRHTNADFRSELEQLTRTLNNISTVPPENRLEPVHAQIRLARIYEMTGRHFEARMGYFKALRWLRQDIRRLEKEHFKNKQDITQTLSFLTPFVGYTVDVLLAVGRLHEEMGEYRHAIQLYSEAESIVATQEIHNGEREEAEFRLRVFQIINGDSGRRRCEATLADLEEQMRLFRGSCDTSPYPSPTALPSSPGAFWPAREEEREQSEALAATLVARDAMPLKPPATLFYDWRRAVAALHTLVTGRRRVAPLSFNGKATSFLDICNHQAVAYSKLWERGSANQCLLRAVIHLHGIGDEYGIIDQMIFTAQIMVRRRDFRAAALWYVEALRRIKALREYSNETPLQSGAVWQTPTVTTQTEAQIYAALGDVYYATGGMAFLSEKDIDDIHSASDPGASTARPSTPANDSELKKRVLENLKHVIRDIDRNIYEDRVEEYFLTNSRMLYESVGDTVSANDVYLRQLDFRLDLFRQSVSWLDTWRKDPSATGTNLASLKYAVLNSWSGFWLGARVLLHAQLSTHTSLTRESHTEWGRISDFRRMGVVLRLIGDMMREIAMHSRDSASRRLLLEQSLHNNIVVPEGNQRIPRADRFYSQFVTDLPPERRRRRCLGVWRRHRCPAPEDAQHAELQKAKARREKQDWRTFNKCSPHAAMTNLEVAREVDVRRLSSLAQCQVPTEKDVRHGTWRSSRLSKVERHKLILGKRVAVNRAARDIRTIYAFLSDRKELIEDPLPGQPDLQKCGFRTLLFRLNGGKHPDDPIDLDHHILPMTYVLHACQAEGQLEHLIRDFRLLVLSEKALLSAYLCHRDTIPDYSYAHTALSLGELYMVALYTLGSRAGDKEALLKKLPLILDRLTEYAKRFLIKAIDVLKREREQNRNTFHLLSEAYFNLGDLLLIRLHVLPQLHEGRHANTSDLKPSDHRAGSWISGGNLFGESYWEPNQAFWENVWERRAEKNPVDVETDEEPLPYGDTEPEDVMRQAWDNYRSGLILVHTEMDEYAARFRFPPDVYYAHRNIMDAVLHFRICRAARARHSGGRYRPSEDSKNPGFDTAEFARRWEEISIGLAKFESPQRFSVYWESAMQQMLEEVNRVRTDRGPLITKVLRHADGILRPHLTWRPAEDLHEHPRLDIFKPYVSSYSKPVAEDFSI